MSTSVKNPRKRYVRKKPSANPKQNEKVNTTKPPKPSARIVKAPVQKQELVTYVKTPQTLQPTVTVSCPFEQNSLKTSFMSLLSYLNQRGITNIDNNANPQSWQTVYNGMNYLYQAVGKLIQSQAVDVDQVPWAVNNLIEALKGKQIRFKEGKISYGWGAFNPSQLLTPTTFCNGIWSPTYLAADTNAYDSPAFVLPSTPDAEDYSQLIRLIGDNDIMSALKFVKLGAKSSVSNDVSAFSRSYTYNGIQEPSLTGGYWKDIENEVPIRAPVLANFCQYVQPDERVPRSLLPYSGSASLPLVWPLLPSFSSYYNKTPPVFNQINFDEFFTLFSLWLSNLHTARAASGPDIGPIDCTTQDAYLTLMTAMMYINNDQCLTQFTGDVRYDGTTNCFVPFLAMGHNTGNSNFGKLMVPTIFAENYNSLLARTVRHKNAKKGGVNQLSYLPVLGRYWRDELPSGFQYKLPDGTLRPLYGNPAIQQAINPTDCSKAPNQYVNTTGTFYSGVQGILNDRIEALQNLSASIQPIAGDAGPKGLFLTGTTRIVNNSIQDMKKYRISGPPPPQPPKILPYAYKIANASAIKKTEDSPFVIPPATIMSLYTTSITAAFPVTEEMKELLDFLILPVSRLNETEDALSIQMLQTIKCEPYNLPYQQNSINFSGTEEFTRLNTYAGFLVPGIGRDRTNKFVQIFDKIAQDGCGGALAQMLGGLGKTFFPEFGPIIDLVASVAPF